METNEILAVDVYGENVYPGDRIFSKFHNKFVVALNRYVDCDGDVYICFNGGNVSVNNIVKVTEQVLPETAIDVVAFMQLAEFLVSDEKFKDQFAERFKNLSEKIHKDYGVMEFDEFQITEALLKKYGV